MKKQLYISITIILFLATSCSTYHVVEHTSYLGSFKGHQEHKKQPQQKETAQRQPRNHDARSVFSYTFENDYMAGSDDGYTNGFRIAKLSPEKNIDIYGLKGKKRFNIAVGQSIYAPGNLSNPDIDQDDRPYAGWAYVSVGLNSNNDRYSEDLQLSIGVVGSSARAAEVQDTVHKLTGATRPRGWNHQLHDEPGLVISYERSFKGLIQANISGLEFDATPTFGLTAGNVHTYGSAGMTLRVGSGLDADLGAPTIRPSLPGSDFFYPQQDIGWYLFSGLEGRTVARNIFLDGNTFRDSHQVDKEHFIAGLQTGAALIFRRFRITYTHVFRTDEFETQSRPEAFGAINISYRY